jgi:hypothetical protein
MPPQAAPTSRRPQDSDFYQQRLKAWQPILTPKWVVCVFLLIGIPFIIIGFVCKAASDSVVEYSAQYDGEGTDATYAGCQLTSSDPPGTLKTCTVTLTTTKDMKAPVYVYYELTNFYQNHRRYVKSRSDNQLAGTFFPEASQLSDCDPLRTIQDGNTTKVLDPCGLIANSYFNDTFTLAPGALTMSESNIAWPSDVAKKFKEPSVNRADYPNVQWLNETYPGVSVTNEHFIVWMRTAALPTFRKLYGHIDSTVPANTTLSFEVEAAYPVAGFEGKKAIVVSTTSFLGGKNAFLGIAYLVVGFLCVFLAAVFGVKQYFGGRRLGDTSFLVYQARR